MGADRDRGYRARADATLELLRSFPFVYVHLKGPDEAGHDGDAPRKRAIVEEIDRGFFGPLLDGLDLARARLAVTADHATPCVLKTHSDDPVPWLLAGGRPVRPVRGPAPKFGCPPGQGAPPPFPAAEVLPRLFGDAPSSRP
jgi:2,3-bisphosphoglycerate-independent phosphoglycerate mutase